MWIKVNKFWIPVEISEINKKKNWWSSLTYQTSRRIWETLIRTSKEFWSQEVYSKMWTFYIPEYMFQEESTEQQAEKMRKEELKQDPWMIISR
jgi:hypothetical protein